jgi:hypothetical protein
MTISIRPTKIKQSYYLLIPKNIADLIKIQANCTWISKKWKGYVIEYSLETSYLPNE